MPSSQALSAIYRDHVHGVAEGRSEMLRAVAARLQRAELAAAAARVRLWAAQLGVQVHPGLEGVAEGGELEMMGGSQLEAWLGARQLALLHSQLGSAA